MSRSGHNAGRAGRGAGAAAAFSLVELLVVIAVVALLAGLLLPAVSQARRRADSVRCASNLRQIGVGIRIYSDEDSGRLPQVPRMGPGPIGADPIPAWVFVLTNALGGVDGIRICPSDVMRPWLRTNGGCSYVLNDYLLPADPPARVTSMTPGTGPDGEPLEPVGRETRLDRLRSPSETFLVFEASELGQRLGDARTHPDTWFRGWENVTADIDPERHAGAANYLFADGHVERIRSLRLRERIERGDNFAVPPGIQ